MSYLNKTHFELSAFKTQSNSSGSPSSTGLHRMAAQKAGLQQFHTCLSFLLIQLQKSLVM